MRVYELPLVRWGENLGAPRMQAIFKHYSAPDLSRCRGSASPRYALIRPLGFKEYRANGNARRGSNPARSRRSFPHPRRAEIFAPPHVPQPLPLPKNDRDDQDGHDVRHLNHRIDGGAGRVFIGVANRVTGYRGLVGGRSFASMLTVFDQFLGVIPSSTAGSHRDGDEKTRDYGPYQYSSQD